MRQSWLSAGSDSQPNKIYISTRRRVRHLHGSSTSEGDHYTMTKPGSDRYADYRLERLAPKNEQIWDEFNASCPEGTLFHSLRWKQIAENLSGTSGEYFLLYKDDEIFGLFPLTEHVIHGFRGLISASYPQSLHVLLRDHRDPLALPFVVEELAGMENGTGPISFVCPASLHQETFEPVTRYPRSRYPFSRDDSEEDMVLDLSRSPPDAIWSTFTKKKRQGIRRFEKDGFVVTEAQTLEDLYRFYQLHDKNIMHIEGTLRPLSHFVDIWNTMPDETRITSLSRGSLVAGGVLTLIDTAHRSVTLTYLSLNRDLPNIYTPSHYIFWEAIRWAWENGFQRVSFGREYHKDLNGSSPRCRIKRDFGAQSQPIYSTLISTSRLLSMGIRSRKYLDLSRSVRARIPLQI